ncbi:hypothetical protein ABZ642_45040 [Streptomyces sp. NPDC007157]|uniref:hypothetical protein n=1 Tax=Streptomyces sp. NPDC007157 TaxID=3154681 RepID=UPI003402B34E
MAGTPVRWAKPTRLGAGPASEAASFVAAPLLAGACFATIGVLGADAGQFRWPGPAMMLLTLAFISLIGSVQYGFQAREFFYSVADIEDWEPSAPSEPGSSGPGSPRPSAEDRKRQHRRDFKEWHRLNRRGALTYNLGIVLLGAGTTLMLAAPDGASLTHAVCRWTASGAAGFATLAELEWGLRDRFLRRRITGAGRRRPRAGDADER